MDVTLWRAALEARTCSTNGQRGGDGWGGGEGGYLEKCRLGWVQLVVGVREREKGGQSTCAGSQAALTGIIVALRSLAFALGFPTLIAR